MATETLGAHLRNLLSPYKTLITLVRNKKEIPDFILESCEHNFKDLLDYSNTDKMEDNYWRDEYE